MTTIYTLLLCSLAYLTLGGLVYNFLLWAIRRDLYHEDKKIAYAARYAHELLLTPISLMATCTLWFLFIPSVFGWVIMEIKERYGNKRR